MNLLNDQTNDFLLGSGDDDADIDAFLADIIPKNNSNNQVNIIKVDSKNKSMAPVQVSKAVTPSTTTNNNFININDCAKNETTSPNQHQESNCDFSDSDIDFEDFMFSDDDFKKGKESKNKSNKKDSCNPPAQEPKKIENIPNIVVNNNIIPEKKNNTPTIQNNQLQEPKKIESNANISIPKNDITSNNTNQEEHSNLDEFCIADDNTNDFDKDVFEISDISLPSTTEVKIPKEEEETKKENTNQTNNAKIENIVQDTKPKIENTNKNNDVKIENTNQVKIENIKVDTNPIKEKNDNQLFDTNKKENDEIELPKLQPKKNVKKRKKPTPRQTNPSPLNILDNLDLSISFGNDKSNDIFDFTNITPDSNETKKTNNKNNTERIKIEKLDKDQNELFQPTNLPPLQTRPLPPPTEVVLKPGLEAFECSFNSNLTYLLSEFRFSFLSYFQSQMHKCFDYESQVNTFLINFNRELNNIFSNMSYYQVSVPLSFTDIESEINSEFKQNLILSSNSNSNKPENELFTFEIEDPILPIEKVELLHSKFSNELPNLLRQVTQESQSLHDSYHKNSNYLKNSKLSQISELESKLLQIDTEKAFTASRANYIRDKHLETQDEIDFRMKPNGRQMSKREELDELIQNLKDLHGKGPKYNSNGNYKQAVDEICQLSSQLAFQSNSFLKKLFQPNNDSIPLNVNNGFMYNDSNVSGFVNNNNNNLNGPATIGYSFDSIQPYSANGFVEDVRNRLLQVRRMREETIEDLRRYEPRYNFPVSGY